MVLRVWSRVRGKGGGDCLNKKGGTEAVWSDLNKGSSILAKSLPSKRGGRSQWRNKQKTSGGIANSPSSKPLLPPEVHGCRLPPLAGSHQPSKARIAEKTAGHEAKACGIRLIPRSVAAILGE